MSRHENTSESSLFETPGSNSGSPTPLNLDGLSPPQRRAVEHAGGPQIVLAGPGSGKTRVITHRVAHLIRERLVRPDRIVAVTYTVKAANQLRDKLTELVGPRGASVNAHTFHGLGLRILRRFADEAELPRMRSAPGAGPVIVDSAQRRRLLREIVREHALFPGFRARAIDAIIADLEDYIDFAADMAISPDSARSFAASARHALSQGRSLAGEVLSDADIRAETQRIDRLAECARAAELYAAACRERNWLSFADLISLPTMLLRTRRRVSDILRSEWRHFVVDEFQDVNPAQIELLRALAPPELNPDVTIVGDDDQSIYEFRGADERALARFAELWKGAHVETLSENYRSTPSIVAVAGSVISRAGSRFAPDKVLRAAGSSRTGSVELIDLAKEPDDADAIAAMILTDMRTRSGAKFTDYAVVARGRGDLARIAAALELEGVPIAAQETRGAIDDEGVQRALSLIEVLVDPNQAHALVRLLLRSPLSMSLEDVQRLSREHREHRRADQSAGRAPLSMIDFLRKLESPAPQVVRLLEWFDDLCKFDAENSADQTIRRIVATIDALHADMPSPRDRARRIAALVALIRFAADRQPRLEEPGDLRAFWSYFQDLSEREQNLGGSSDLSRIDDDSPEQTAEADAVRLITAHSSKGLEFDTVFVPRVNPSHGYPSIKGDDRESDLPTGLIERPADNRTLKERLVDEERRVFYVACTRAARRLVLLAKKNKTKSKSTHFLEELKFDPAMKPHTACRSMEEVFADAARASVGGAHARWRSPSESDAERELHLSPSTRAEIVAKASRDARRIAAAALDAAEADAQQHALAGASRAPEAAALAASDAALCISIASYAGRTGQLPEWAADPNGMLTPRVREFSESLARELAGSEAAAEITDQSALAALIRARTPKGPLRLSYSQLQCYVNCPRCYFALHVLGLPEHTGGNMRVGSIVHSALHRLFQRLQAAEAEGTALPDKNYAARLAREIYQRDVPVGERDPLEAEHAAAQVVRALDLHPPSANVLELEKEVILPFGEHKLAVRLDRIDNSPDERGSSQLTIIDYKTGEATKTKLEPAKDDLQLCVYALAAQHLYEDPHLEGAAEYWVLSSGERGRLPFSHMKLDKVRNTISESIAGILAGDFARKSSNSWYFHACDAIETFEKQPRI